VHDTGRIPRRLPRLLSRSLAEEAASQARLMIRPRTDLLARKLARAATYTWRPIGALRGRSLHRAHGDAGLSSAYEGFAPRQAWRPETRFEQKGKASNHEIYELMFVKRAES
jgi:tRNA (guanine-N7-)-methyltransferase